MPQKAIKGQAVANLLVDHPVPGTSKLYDDISDEIAEVDSINASSEEQVWQLFFDRASKTNPEGNIITSVGVVLISPQNYVIPCAFSLTEPCSNNVSEYNVLLIGMQLAEEIGIKNLEAYGDSNLIVNQVRREYEVRHEDLVPYYNATIIMTKKFENFYIDHVPHQQNAHADALASFAVSWPFQPKLQRECLSTVVTCTVANSPFKTVKLQEETFKLNRFLRFRQVSNLEIGDSLTLTSSCMAYFLTTLRRQLPSEEKFLDYTIMRSCEHCIVDRTMESYSNAFHTKRHRRHSKRLMTVCVEFTNPNLSSKTDLEDLAIIGQR